MTIDQLLPRAAELAPEWCKPLDYGQYSLVVGDRVWLLPDETYEKTSALILFAVLQECERRGYSGSLRWYPHKDGSSYSLYLEKNQPASAPFSGPVASDPATACLSALVSLLEMEVKA